MREFNFFALNTLKIAKKLNSQIKLLWSMSLKFRRAEERWWLILLNLILDIFWPILRSQSWSYLFPNERTNEQTEKFIAGQNINANASLAAGFIAVRKFVSCFSILGWLRLRRCSNLSGALLIKRKSISRSFFSSLNNISKAPNCFRFSKLPRIQMLFICFFAIASAFYVMQVLLKRQISPSAFPCSWLFTLNSTNSGNFDICFPICTDRSVKNT